MAHYGDYQNEIYGAGLRGIVPGLPVDFANLKARAEAAMAPHVLSYVQGGCGDEGTQDRNAEAFAHWGMVPRMMVDCSKRDLSTELFGQTLPSPLFMSPIGVNGICTQDGHGDLAAAKASAKTGVPFMASTLSNDPLEDVISHCGDTPAFFQLYTPKNRDLALSLISRAEKAGYRALVITLDTWVTGWRPRDLNTANFPQLRGPCPAELLHRPRLPRHARRSARGGSPGSRRGVGRDLRAGPDMGGHGLAARSDFASSRPQGDLPSRRRAAGGGQGR
nr:alpha-hydroxy-acid oxidizing protein [Parvularcula oceani]